MRAMKSEVFAIILAVSIPAVAMAQGALEIPMVAIEGGSYPIGSAEGPASTRPAHRVRLTPFLIDVHEVTNAQFAAFLNTLEVKAKRDVPAGELSSDDDVEGQGHLGRLHFHNALTALLGTTTMSSGFVEMLIGEAGQGLIIAKRPI